MLEYNPFGKELSKIRKVDLNKLIKNEVEEGWYIEFKSDFPSNKKIAHSIAAFANSDGGWFIIGVIANKDNIAESIIGFDLAENSRCKDKIRDIAKSNISPPPYFESKLIKISKEKAVLVVMIEKGLETPYVTLNGKIYRRVGAGSDPVPETDRYTIQKLFEQSEALKERLNRFSENLYSMSIFQSEQNICFLEMYFYLKPSIQFDFKNFYSSAFFNKLKTTFSSPAKIIMDPLKASFSFDTCYSSFYSYILRYLGGTENTMDLGPTIEVFGTGNAKILFPFSQHDISAAHDDLPKALRDSANYIKFKQILKAKGGSDFRIIDGYHLFLSTQIMFNQYYQLLKEEKFQRGLLARLRLTNTWRTVLYLDDENYLKFLDEHGLPVCLKSEIEIPEFVGGRAIMLDNFPRPDLTLAGILLESLGYPLSVFPDSMRNLGEYLYKISKGQED